MMKLVAVFFHIHLPHMSLEYKRVGPLKIDKVKVPLYYYFVTSVIF
jgi:hypothetical protein